MAGKHASPKRRPAPQRRPKRGNPLTTTPDYEGEEVEFIMAMDRFKRERKRPFPSWSEVLTVLKSLGWKKQAKVKE
jgi:hypothetical protein